MPIVARAAAAAHMYREEDKRMIKYREIRKRRYSGRGAAPDFLGCCGSETHNTLVYWMRGVRDSYWFTGTIIGFILLAGILVGVQTYDINDPRVVTALDYLDWSIIGVFILEFLIKVVAEGVYPWRYFFDRWNIFDFLILALSLLPFGGQAIVALRLIRLGRVLKLVRALPQLRILVQGLASAFGSIGYIGLLLLLCFYLFAVLGVTLFGKNDPKFMGSLHMAMLTLFRVSVGDDWTDVAYTAMFGCDNFGYDAFPNECTAPTAHGWVASLFFVAVVIISTFFVLNLFVGAITAAIADAKSELEHEHEEEEQLFQDDEDDDERMENRLNELSEVMAKITDAVEEFAQLEKERKASSIIKQATSRVGAGSSSTAAGGQHPKQFWQANAAGHHASLASLLSTPGGGLHAGAGQGAVTPGAGGARQPGPQSKGEAMGSMDREEAARESKGMPQMSGFARAVGRVIESPAKAMDAGSEPGNPQVAGAGDRAELAAGSSGANASSARVPFARGRSGSGEEAVRRPLLGASSSTGNSVSRGASGEDEETKYETGAGAAAGGQPKRRIEENGRGRLAGPSLERPGPTGGSSGGAGRSGSGSALGAVGSGSLAAASQSSTALLHATPQRRRNSLPSLAPTVPGVAAASGASYSGTPLAPPDQRRASAAGIGSAQSGSGLADSPLPSGRTVLAKAKQGKER